MKIYLISYTSGDYRIREEYILSLQNIGFDSVICYRREWLETTDFYLENKEILDMSRGGGYWLWKPYIIIETMKKINDGDVVFYIDAADTIRNNYILNKIKSYMINNDYMIAGSHKRRLNKYYTKRDTFILMDCDEGKYYNARQIEAGTVIFKKTKIIETFLNEWLYYCKNINIITNIQNIHGKNLRGFIDHRSDQSILTNLVIKHNMKYNEVLYSQIKHNAFKLKKP